MRGHRARVKARVGVALATFLFACLPSSAAAFTFVQTAGSPYPTTHPAFVPSGARYVGGMATGDFNGDGISDVAVVNATGVPAFDAAGESVTVLLGERDGGLTMVPGSPVGVFSGGNLSEAGPIAVGDFNGDGNLDVAVATQMNNTVSVLMGDGTGRLKPPGAPIPVSGSSEASIAVGDFNGDGKLDLAVANNDVNVLLGDGSGGFTPAPGSPLTLSDYAGSIVAGDFNGDGRSDLAVAHQTGVMVYLSNSEGGLQAAPGSPLAVGTSPAAIAAADLTGDGKLDLVTANPLSGDVTVLLGNGSGGFAPAGSSPFPVPVGPGGGSSCLGLPGSIAIGDFGGDGKADLAVANFNGCSNSVAILQGHGSGGFTDAEGSPFNANFNPSPLVVGDFNGDGEPDLAVVNGFLGAVTVLQSTTGGLPEKPTLTRPTSKGTTVTRPPKPIEDTTRTYYSPSDGLNVPVVPSVFKKKATKCGRAAAHVSHTRKAKARSRTCRVHQVAMPNRSRGGGRRRRSR